MQKSKNVETKDIDEMVHSEIKDIIGFILFFISVCDLSIKIN